ncbi:MAG: hypothetical protein K2X28_03110 [Alphaproteobacteria bacterium]|nr:hypothetical protein [Alphaproteobacteria bacterium]
MYLLVVTTFTSSLSFANIDSSFKDLDLEETRVILRALNTKFRVDWLSVKSNHPKRREEMQKILNFLTFILDERLKKIVSLSTQLREKFCDLRFKRLLDDWYLRKVDTCNETKKAQLRGESDNSHSGDLYTFEWLSRIPNESADSLIQGSVMVSNDEEKWGSFEVYFPPKPRNGLFPPELQTELGIPSTPSITSPKPVIRSSKSRMPLGLSKKSLKSSRESSIPVVSSLPEASSSAMSVRRPAKSSKRSLKSSSSPSESIVCSSTSINTEEDSERLQLQQDMKDRETLLLDLDEKGAKIALQAILNNYLISIQEFNFSDSSDLNRYKCVHDYLNCILQSKMTKASRKKEKLSSADVESAEFGNFWYEQKRLEYEGRLEIIWELFRQVHQPQAN